MVQDKVEEFENFNKERKMALTHNVEKYFKPVPIPEEWLEDMRKFQRVTQLKFESAVREIFIETLDMFEDQLSSVWDTVLRSVKKTEEKHDNNSSFGSDVSMQEFFKEKEINVLSRDAVLLSRITRKDTIQFKL